MVACAQWFRALPPPDSADTKVVRVLLFNTTGDRDVQSLLEPLVGLELDQVVFCTNLARQGSGRRDQENFTTTSQAQVARCQEMAEAWRRVAPSVPARIIPCIDSALAWVADGREPALRGLFEGQGPGEGPGAEGRGLEGPGAEGQRLEGARLQVLVTGSLHLVGGVLACLQGSEGGVTNGH
jgi:folylpolyglutamate synthase/dihydropteroate synthase